MKAKKAENVEKPKTNGHAEPKRGAAPLRAGRSPILQRIGRAKADGSVLARRSRSGMAGKAKGFGMRKEVPTPTQTTVLDKTDVRMLLRDLLPAVGDSQVFISDERYYLPTKNEIRAILRDSALNNRNFRAELNDCDDFSMALKVEVNAYALNIAAKEVPLCFGIIWAKFDFNSGDPHAVNWFIDQSRALCFVEPQTDELFEADALVSGVRLILT